MIDVRRERYEQKVEWPLAGCAVVFLLGYAVPILDTTLDPTPWELVVTATWVVFVADFAVRVWLSSSRWHFLRTHPLDVMVVLLPVLRPLRLLRLLTLISVLSRAAGSAAVRGRVVLYLVSSTALLLFVSSLAVLDAERRAVGSTITGYDDAAWWAITTMTTVGYGDRYPVTGTGRLIAAALMIGGIAVLGTVTATLASFIIEQVQDAEQDARAATRRDLRVLTEEVHALRRELTGSSGRNEPA